MQFIFGQQTQEGAPYSQIYGLENSYHTITLPQIDRDMLLEEDIYREPGTPFRYGYKHEVKYSPESSGTWEETTDGGMLWRLGIHSPNAYGMKIFFDSYWLPEGGSIEKIGFFQYFHSKNTPLVSLFVLVGPHKGCSR